MAYDYFFSGTTGDKTTDAVVSTVGNMAYDAGSAVYNKVFASPTPEAAHVTPAGITKAPANTTLVSNG